MQQDITLVRNNDKRDISDLEWIDEFYKFLQGESPNKISMGRGHALKLSPQKAFSVIWYLQEHFSVFPDNIEKCSYCDSLFDANAEGGYWETKGKHFCSSCSDRVPRNYDRGRK